MKGKREIGTRVVDDTLFHPAFQASEARHFNAPNQEQIGGGTKLILLGRGNHYRLPDRLPALQAEDELKKAGIALKAGALCILDLSPQYSLILFDRGPRKQDVPEPLLDVPSGRDNVIVSDRFFLLDATAHMQVGISAGAGQGRKELNGFMQFCAGYTLFLGRDYAEELNHDALPEYVSAKHAAIDCQWDGSITIYDCLSTNGTAITHSTV